MSSHILQNLTDDGVLQLQFNRPEKKNALDFAMYTALADAIIAAERSDTVRVILISGSGDTFTAGNDLNDFLNQSPQGRYSPIYRFVAAVIKTDLPIVAAVNGAAIGIGVTLLLHCDQVFAAADASFATPFIDLGVVPEAGASLLLPRVAGYQRAVRMLMLGEPFDAQAARDAGLVAEVVPPARLQDEAMAMARKLAAKPRDALRLTKQLLRRADESVIDRFEAEMQAFIHSLQTPAALEAMQAFLDRR